MVAGLLLRRCWQAFSQVLPVAGRPTNHPDTTAVEGPARLPTQIIALSVSWPTLFLGGLGRSRNMS